LREESLTAGVGGAYTVCAAGGGELSDERQRLVYTSKTSVVDVRLVAGPTQRQQQPVGSDATASAQFLLRYELFGCVEPPIPRHGGMQRTDTDAILWCNETGEQWQLKCERNQWIGIQKNCSTSVHSDVAGIGWETLNSSKGISMLLVLAIAFTVGLFMVIIGSVYLHRLRQRRERTIQLEQRPTGSGYYSTQQQFIVKQTDGIDVDSLQLSENDYYKSWQHQQQQTMTTVVSNTPLTPYSDVTGNCSSKQFTAEHIYESPKFDQKDDVAFEFS
jgi:hypothetical protein